MNWLTYHPRWRAFRIWFARTFNIRWVYIDDIEDEYWERNSHGPYVYDGIEFIYVDWRKS